MLSFVSPSSNSFGLSGRLDNGEMDTLTSQSQQDDYQQIYSRDEEIYGDCVYDSHDYDDYESEDDCTIESEKDYWHDVRFVPLSSHTASSRRTNSSTLTNWPFKPILICKKRPIETKVIQPLLDSPEISEIPVEVLEILCGHLSQTSLRSINRVCKAWYKISERFVRHTGIWKPVDGVLQVLIERWSKLDTLRLWISQDPDFPNQAIKTSDQNYYWAAFVAAITGSTKSDQDTQADNANADNISNNNLSNNDYHDDSESNAKVSLHMHRNIRHLDLVGRFLSYSDHVSVLRGHFQFIQSLTITAPKRDDPIPLFTILADFPALKSLTFTIQSNAYFTDLCHGDDQDSIDVPADLIDPSKNFTEEYQLERFCLSRVGVDRRILERLIVTCPDLRVFNVKDINIEMCNTENDHSDEVAAIREVEECTARQRLVDLVAKHCPKMEWYSFHRIECSTNENHLKMVASKFQNQKMHSMAFDGYAPPLNTLVIRNQLSKITVLQVHTRVWSGQSDSQSSESLNKILCMTPRLLHLIGSETYFDTKYLWKPPAPVKPKHPFTTLGDLKRREHKERRRALQQARVTRGRYHVLPATETPAVDPSIPVIWQVYNLKSFEMNLSYESGMADLTGYIIRYRLFRNLSMLNLQIPLLKIGQRMIFANTRAGAAAAVAAADAAVASSGIELQLGQPVRYPNELLALRSLRCLEDCTLRAKEIPGTVVPKNLLFMKRKEDFQAVSFFPLRNKRKRRKTKKAKHGSQKAKTTMTTKTPTDVPEKVIDQTEDEDEGEDEEEDEEEKRWKNETFWPVLNVFHIYYSMKSPTINTGDLAEAFERFRPGVEFRIQGFIDVL